MTLELEAAGASASWSFTATYYDIDFQTTFKPKGASEAVVVDASRNETAKRFVQGSYTCTTPGTFTLTFSNPNWYYSKPVEYRVEAVAADMQQRAESDALAEEKAAEH